MTQYKTYQEAKIANPDSEIYHSGSRRVGDKGFFSTREYATSFHYKCKPEDYCVSLESFLASGKRLVCGDLFIGSKGKVSAVASPTAMNDPQGVDSNIYILKVKALENPAHEWANGDECTYSNMDYIFVGMTPTFNDVSCIMFSPKNGIEHVSVRALRKPETPEQKLERQRLESAYHLACIAGVSNIWGNDITFDDFQKDEVAVKRWLAIVDETNYLLYE